MSGIQDVIDRINSPQAGTSAGGATTPNANSAINSTLDQAAFLRLLTTQLTNQDPFSPMDNTQMIAQMAQFSQVAGIAQMNTALSNIQDSLAGSRLSNASSWIGRNALVQSDVATPLNDGTYAGSLGFASATDATSISFVDASGNTVHTMDLGARPAGESTFTWNGKDANGNVVATGPLRIVVNATAAGSAVTPTVATWTGIAGIQSPSSGAEARLVTGLGLLTPEQAIRLS